jgi:hypothetical protein
MGFFSYTQDHLREFHDVLVHPSQEMRDPDGAFFRGGPEWPHFAAQIVARHCRGALPRPIDARPLRARAKWPYFDPRFLPVFWPQLGSDPQRPPGEIARLAETLAPLPEQIVDGVDCGIWCGPISLHFGETIAAFGMRIAGSSRADSALPLVFTLPPFRDLAPRQFFWDILDHLGIDKGRVLLVRTPTRFDRLCVIPQAERLYGGGPHPRHLDLMDEMTAGSAPVRDLDCVFISRSQLPDGHFAGESYLDEVLAAAGVTVLHPETTDSHTQLRLYRRARLLIFSEGSALHALQLLGHLDCDIIVLARRLGNRMMVNSLRPRARSVRYVPVRGLVYGSSRSGYTMQRAGISVLDDTALQATLAAAGVDLGPFWRGRDYAKRCDTDIAAWTARQPAMGGVGAIRYQSKTGCAPEVPRFSQDRP